MRCAYCDREFTSRRRWLGSSAWCSGSCRRRMTAEVRELVTWVERWGAAVERPDVVAARDDLVRRYLAARIRRPPAGASTRSKTVFPRVDLGTPPLTE